MANYQEARVKLTNTQFNKLQSAEEKAGKTLRITKKSSKVEKSSNIKTKI